MRRPYLGELLLCLSPSVVVGLVVGYILWHTPQKPELERDGGAILVYEINLERSKQRREQNTGGLSDAEMKQLTKQLRQRLDPADLRNIAVNPLGESRIEIAIPHATIEDVEEAKWLISRLGVLEFRMVANGIDDAEVREVMQWMESSATLEALQQRATEGLPPPVPEGEFKVEIGESRAKVQYAWVELGPEERESLGLNNANEMKGGQLWAAVAASCSNGKSFAVQKSFEGYVPAVDPANASFILLSRKCVSRDQLAREEAETQRLRREHPDWPDEDVRGKVDRKKYDFFILTRISPQDSLRVGGDVALLAAVDTDSRGKACVDFRLNVAGAQRFRTLTRRNKPDGVVTRSLAILLDDRVLSIPTLQAEIGERGQISGQFDQQTVERLAKLLQSGGLPAELRERPVSEQTVTPTVPRTGLSGKSVAVLLAVGSAFLTCLVSMLVLRCVVGKRVEAGGSGTGNVGVSG
jgi:SecD/SecF fusion protein